MQTPAQQDRKAAIGLVLHYGRDMSRAYYRRQWKKAAELVTKMAHLHRFLDGKLKNFPETKPARKAMSRVTPVPHRSTTRRKRRVHKPAPATRRQYRSKVGIAPPQRRRRDPGPSFGYHGAKSRRLTTGR